MNKQKQERGVHLKTKIIGSKTGLVHVRRGYRSLSQNSTAESPGTQGESRLHSVSGVVPKKNFTGQHANSEVALYQFTLKS